MVGNFSTDLLRKSVEFLYNVGMQVTVIAKIILSSFLLSDSDFTQRTTDRPTLKIDIIMEIIRSYDGIYKTGSTATPSEEVHVTATGNMYREKFANLVGLFMWCNVIEFARYPQGLNRSAGPFPGNSLGQAAHTHVPLSPSSII